MKIIGLLVIAGLTGCAASFQPFNPVSRAEFNALAQQMQQNDQLLAQKIAEMAPKPKEVAKK